MKHIFFFILLFPLAGYGSECQDNLIPSLNKDADIGKVSPYLESLSQTVLFSSADVDGSYCSLKQWYEDRMSSRRFSSRSLAILVIVLGASLPLIAIMDDVFKKQKFWIAFIGAAIVIAQGFSQTFQYEESWRNYTVAKLDLESALRLWQKQVIDSSFSLEGLAMTQEATDKFSVSVSKIVIKETTGFFDSRTEAVENLTRKSNGTP